MSGMQFAYPAVIRDVGRGREKHGVVEWEFRSLGKFVFREDGREDKRIFDRQWWTVIPVGKPTE